jgi:hypothetical protein
MVLMVIIEWAEMAQNHMVKATLNFRPKLLLISYLPT